MQLDLAPISAVELRTERLLLRPLEEGDRERYLAFESANREFFGRYAPPPPGVVDAASSFERFLRRTKEGLALGNGVRFSIFLPGGEGEGGEMVGNISVSDIVRGQAQRANIGYRIGEAYCGKGLATEALRAVVAFAFAVDGLRLHRVECSVQPGNGASLAVAKKAGFVEEGFFPRFLFIGGDWRDHMILARRAD